MCKFVSFVTVLKHVCQHFFAHGYQSGSMPVHWVIVWAQNKRTLVKARIICSLMWVLSIGCSIPFVLCRSGENSQCAYVCSINILKSLFICRFIVGFLIPFLIIASSYIAIGVRAKRLKRGKKLKPFGSLYLWSWPFFICWFPFHVQQLSFIIAKINGWRDVENVFIKIGPFVNCLVHLNSCLNPILYVFMCEEFKKKLKQSLLLVLETAFAEEHLPFRTSRPSTCSRLSESQGLKQTNETTISSCGSNQDNNTCF